MVDPDLAISGGAGGIGAKLDDMRTESAQLSAMTAQLLEQSLAAAGIALDADLHASTVLSPVTALAAKLQIGFATGQMVLYATEAGVTAVFLASAVEAYEAVDRTLALAGDLAVNASTFAAGVMAVPIAGVLARVAAADLAFVYIAGYGGEAVKAFGEGLAKTLEDPWKLPLIPLLVNSVVANTIESYDGADAQATVDALLAEQLAMLNELAGDNAWAVDLIAQGAAGLLAGLTLPLMLRIGPVATNALLAAVTGTPWPPTSFEQALEAIIGGGNRAGILDDGPLLTGDNLILVPLIPFGIATPVSLKNMLLGSAQIDKYDGNDGKTDSFARIRITKVESAPPKYIVQIPSTQAWDPVAGSAPNDVTGDTAAMLARQTALSSAVDAAMKEAGITPTDDVMLQGFSLGGITAGQMAGDTSLGYNITHVVTSGAPIGNFDIPSRVKVLAMEFDEDPVPKLDGNNNPSSSHWSTVQSSAPQLEKETAAPGIAGAHSAARYAITAGEVQASDDSSIREWLESASGFFPPDAGADVSTSTNPASEDAPVSTTTTTEEDGRVTYFATTTDYGAQRG